MVKRSQSLTISIMIIKGAEFIISNTDYKLCPKELLPEYAFIGRSNVANHH